MGKKYITTTLPYVNADPHIGFALEMVQADTIARYWSLTGQEVIFNTGTDEHGQKIYQNALKENKDPQTYCDEYASKFHNLKTALNLSYTNFIRTTDKNHIAAAQEFWNLCYKNGDIYKKSYKIKYCVGCELEKTESELVDSRCPIHPNLEIEIIEEENYFFRFSAYRDKLLKLYDENPDFIVPDYRLKEIKNFVEKGLEDFSISRLKSKMPWGVNVPNDPDHVMYVWFDALINYISTLGWPSSVITEWWGTREHPNTLQIAGKDNLRQQSAMWQAMLMSAELPPSKQIIIHGFITSDGQKMSKSLGNVINPFDVVKKYGTDAVRYYLLREIPTFEDGDFSWDRMQELYNNDLTNELGNTLSRITTLAEKDHLNQQINSISYSPEIGGLLSRYSFNSALERIWQDVKKLNKKIDEFSPWKKEPEPRKDFLLKALLELNIIGQLLKPFLPSTADIIITATQGAIRKPQSLFPRM